MDSYCSSSADCIGDERCMTAQVYDPLWQLLRFRTKEHHDLLYVGAPTSILRIGTRILSQIPLSSLTTLVVHIDTVIPRAFMFPYALPRILSTTIRYTVSLSFALSILNMIPAFWMDGRYALSAFSELLLPVRGRRESRKQTLRIIATVCTAIVGIITIFSLAVAVG
jgi:membrane-associated protease RseP (regulator of RpoE activity)